MTDIPTAHRRATAVLDEVDTVIVGKRGATEVVLAGVLAALSSGVRAVAVLVRRGRGGAVPHGPSMLLACLLVVAAGARGP